MPIEDFQFPQSLNYFSYQFHYTVTRRHVPIKVIDKSNICKLRNKGAERHGGREVSSATTVLYTLQLYFIKGPIFTWSSKNTQILSEIYPSLSFTTLIPWSRKSCVIVNPNHCWGGKLEKAKREAGGVEWI